jgi:hypothetical protein
MTRNPRLLATLRFSETARVSGGRQRGGQDFEIGLDRGRSRCIRAERGSEVVVVTIRIPKWVLAVMLVVLVGGGGAAIGYLLSEFDSQPDSAVAEVTTTVNSTTTSTTTTGPNPQLVPYIEVSGLLGEQVMVDLLDRNIIHEVHEVEPKPGWTTEFKVDTGGGVIRFRDTDDGKEVEWVYLRTTQGHVFGDAVEEIVEARGFDPV